MSVTIRVHGVEQAVAALGRYESEKRGALSRAVAQTAVQGVTRMKRYVTNPSPSSPGNAPGVDTGQYRASWRHNMLPPLGAEVFTDVEYGPYLEYGTRRMGARPHVGPVSEHMKEDFKANVTEALRD